MPSIIKKVENYFIGPIVESTKDYFVITKARLAYNLSMILIVLCSPIAIALLLQGLITEFLLVFASLLFLFAVIFVLRFKKDVTLAAKVYVTMALSILVFCYAPQVETLGTANQAWYFVLFLFSYFTIGKRWAIGVMIISILSVGYYTKFMLYENLHNEIVYEDVKINAVIIGVPLVFYAIYYMLTQFMKTQQIIQKELELGNKRLEQQNKIITKQKDEKTAMIKEIHHRVKNNLQIINSMLRIQSRSIDDERMQTAFEEAQNRVITIASLHENLYKFDDFNQLDVEKHFEELLHRILKMYGKEGTIELDMNVTELSMGVKTMVPLGLMINELFTNTIKYAFEEGEKGKFILHIEQNGNDQFKMLIGDNGIGKPKEFDDAHEQSMGSELVEIFVDELEGTIDRLDEPGTMYKICFQSIDND